ncbi:MAG TPA: LptF/LptG family permease [Gemmatimonadaceae bacterium]|nr:LptF/LptG family permease [Gemmatimonadaceae bacterium]
MKILTKYVLKEHVGPFVFAATAVTSLMLLQYVGKRLGDLVGKGLPWRVVGEFFVLSLPLTVALTLPMAVLVAVLYAYSRMASENEITAMRANGISMRTLMVPTFFAGLVVAIVMLVFNDQVLSGANHQLAVLQNDIARTKPSFALKEQIINTVVDQKLYMRAARIDRASQQMRDVVIYDVSNPAHRRTIYADSGTLGFAANRTDLVMHLYDGWMVEVPTQSPTQLTRLFYKRDLLRVPNVTNTFTATDADSATKSDREMSVCEMQRHFADVDYRWQEAAYERAQAQARILQLKGEKHVQWPTKPVRRNPMGLGRIYCGLLHAVFGVKTAEAATLAPSQAGGARVAQQRVPARPAQQQQQAVPPQGVQRPLPPSAGGVPAPVPADTGVEIINGQRVLRSFPQARPGQQGPPEFDPGLNEIQLRGEAENALGREKVMRYMTIRYDIEIQKKFSLAAACLIFVLLGPPIALRFPRGGVGLVIGVSFAVFALYYVGLIGGETLADSEIISPFWAMWGANLILFVLGIVLTARMNQVSGATRGGDWSEIRETLRHLYGRLIGRAPREAA